MEQRRPSTTAERAALLRAAHQLLDAPRILDDPLALGLISRKRAAALRTNPQASERGNLRRLRASIAVRSRYAEDCLRDAVGRGARQYVILGAGLDSFAYRNPFSDLRVFEVDHPATQAGKLARLRAGDIPLPASLTFVPIDFEWETLARAMRAGGLAPGDACSSPGSGSPCTSRARR